MFESVEELLRKLRCYGMLENFTGMMESTQEKSAPWLKTFQKLLEVEYVSFKIIKITANKEH